MLLILIL
jgi:hypothetical protein